MPSVHNQTKNTIIASDAKTANSFFSQAVGLIGRKPISSREGLLLPRCRCIHMCFMRFPIDVIFIDRQNMVVGLVKEIKPFHISPYFSKAQTAIEIAAGRIVQSKTEIADKITIS